MFPNGVLRRQRRDQACPPVVTQTVSGDGIPSTLGLPMAANAERALEVSMHTGGLTWGRLPTPPPRLCRGVEAAPLGLYPVNSWDPLRGGSHTTPQSPRRVVRYLQTRPSGCPPGLRRPRPLPRVPHPDGPGKRVRGWRTLHRGPRAAQGRSGAGALGPSREQEARAEQQAEALAARAPRAHPPSPPPSRAAAARAPAPADLRGPVGARPAPPSARRGAALAARRATWRGKEALRDCRGAAAGSDVLRVVGRWAPPTSRRPCGAGTAAAPPPAARSVPARRRRPVTLSCPRRGEAFCRPHLPRR